ncbi:MAG: Rieske (2Fe-2S) protein [Chitinophagaceae bacterium]|nr:Rieske (2Fe-2S) protein [Chitinophagaceae bacterium]
MSDNHLTWHKVADYIHEPDFAENQIALVSVNGKKICIARVGESLFAFAHKCPHAGGRLSEGYIDSHSCVVCPLHRFKFDIRTGRNVSGEGYHLKSWPVKTDEEGIYVAMESKRSSWFRL